MLHAGVFAPPWRPLRLLLQQTRVKRTSENGNIFTLVELKSKNSSEGIDGGLFQVDDTILFCEP